MTPVSKKKNANCADVSAAEKYANCVVFAIESGSVTEALPAAATKTADVNKNIRNIEMKGNPQFSMLNLFSLAAIFLNNTISTPIILTLTNANEVI